MQNWRPIFQREATERPKVLAVADAPISVATTVRPDLTSGRIDPGECRDQPRAASRLFLQSSSGGDRKFAGQIPLVFTSPTFALAAGTCIAINQSSVERDDANSKRWTPEISAEP